MPFYCYLWNINHIIGSILQYLHSRIQKIILYQYLYLVIFLVCGLLKIHCICEVNKMHFYSIYLKVNQFILGPGQNPWTGQILTFVP